MGQLYRTPIDIAFWIRSGSSCLRRARRVNKFHFRTAQGIENLTDAQAGELIGRDRESHQRDL
ncbi:hypothetical protein JCM9534A_10030 [Catenuloplanes indicus JCM 9534]